MKAVMIKQKKKYKLCYDEENISDEDETDEDETDEGESDDEENINEGD